MPATGPGRATARLTLRSDARELRKLRQKLKSIFDTHSIRTDLSDDLILVANELTTNAIEASALGSEVTVEVHVDREHVTLAIENVGPPFTVPPDVTLPDKSNLRGRGLALSSRIVDDLCSEALVDGTRIVAKCARR